MVATADNAQRNSISADDFIVVGPEQENQHLAPSYADTVVANILAEPLMMLAPKLVDLLKPGGLLVLAGLIESQVAAVAEHYLPEIELHVADQTDEWVCLVGRKRQN